MSTTATVTITLPAALAESIDHVAFATKQSREAVVAQCVSLGVDMLAIAVLQARSELVKQKAPTAIGGDG